jgi:hypothetical protein
LVVSGSLACAAGVPPVAPDYDSTVEVWWAKHPFNPKNKRPEIGLVQPVVPVPKGGNLQEAIDKLPAEGGTLELEPGADYAAFALVGRSNVHIVGRRTDPAKPLGTGERPRILGGLAPMSPVGHIAAHELALEYGPFDKAVSLEDNPNHGEAMAILRDPARNFYFRDLEFYGGDVADNALQLQCVKDVVFENCRFAGFVDRKSTHGALVNGHAGLENIWFLDCDFAGLARYAIYLDGAHGSGAVGCRFAAKDEALNEGFTAGVILNLTNDDFTEDVDASGTIDRREERNAKYNVYQNNTFGTSAQIFAMTGENILIVGNTLEGNCNRFAYFDSRAASTNHRLWDANGRDHRYEYENLRVEDNTVTGACLEAFVVFYHGANRIEDKRPGETTPPMGRWVIRNNVIGSTPKLIKTDAATPPATFAEPQIAEGNTGDIRAD